MRHAHAHQVAWAASVMLTGVAFVAERRIIRRLDSDERVLGALLAEHECSRSETFPSQSVAGGSTGSLNPASPSRTRVPRGSGGRLFSVP